MLSSNRVAKCAPQGRRRTLVAKIRGAMDQSVPLYTKFSQPVYSLATQGTDIPTRPTLNLLTYLSPVAIKPDRCFAIGLYLGTVSHANMKAHRRGLLQVLRPSHATLFQLLGKTSARDVDKLAAVQEAGFFLKERYGVMTFDDAASVMELEVVSDFLPCGGFGACKLITKRDRHALSEDRIGCPCGVANTLKLFLPCIPRAPNTLGDHDVVICRVVRFENFTEDANEVLHTSALRAAGYL